MNDIAALQAATTERTIAVILEPVQGEGGVNVAPPAYFQAVRRWCDEQQLVLILDEIQTGIGRTGTLFAYQQLGIEPDIMTLAKGLGGGLAIGALLARERFCVFEPGDHGTTFGGSPLACAGALATLRFIIEHDVPAAAAARGAQLRAGLEALQREIPAIVDVRGMGLLLGLGLASELAPRIVDQALQRGLLLNPVRPDTIRFMPPLIATPAEVDECVAILRDSIVSVLDQTAAVRGR